MSTTTLHRKSATLAVVVLVVAAIAAALVLINRQSIIDRFVAWQYTPTEQVARFVDDAGMNPHGELLFYASQPKLLDNQQFGKKCTSSEPVASILGCYVNNQIYVYDVTNEKLAGIRSVTAAHEMLHAAYQRLSDSDRTHVNRMVEDNYRTVKDQADLVDVMKIYAKSEPGEADNELHSLLGTEIANLSPELEAYYKRYFSDRSKVVESYESYRDVFTQLNKQADALTKQLKELKTRIETDSAQYSSATEQLNHDIAAFNGRATDGGFSSQAEFETARAALQSRVAQLETERQTINQTIAQYSDLAKQYNALATRSQTLNDSINSSLPATPQVY